MKGAPECLSSSSLQGEGTANSETTHNHSSQPLSNGSHVLIPHQSNLESFTSLHDQPPRARGLPCSAYPVSECEAEGGC